MESKAPPFSVYAATIIFWIFIQNINFIFAAQSVDERCTPIHSRAWGIELTCCGPNSHLPETCDYHRRNFTLHHCLFAPGVPCMCSIALNVDAVECDANVPVPVWIDHYNAKTKPKPYLCRNPNFPNPEAEFSALIRLGSRPTTLSSDFLLGLSRYKIMELELAFDLVDRSSTIFLQDNFFTYFRNVKRLKFVGATGISRSNIGQRQQLSFPESFAKLRHLQMLTVKNFSNLLFPNSATFVSNLLYLQIYQCPITKIPNLLEEAHKIEYIKVQYTNVEDVRIIGRLQNLKLCFLSRNKIRDLTSTMLTNKKLTDLDLSYNQIETIGPETFAGLSALIFLDLSNNPMARIPGGIFVMLKMLKWLYLSHEDEKRPNHLLTISSRAQNHRPTSGPSLDYLGAQHFAGLANLQYLSLANNPSLKLDRLVFKPLENLEKLDLQNCNLTILPESLVDLCKLKYVRLNGNRLKSALSFPPQTFAYLSQRLNEIDINENSIDEIPKSLFLTPVHKTALIESIVMALKQQPIWWLDKCCAFYWQNYLIDENQNSTLRAYYSSKFGSAFSQTAISSLNEADKTQCKQHYSKMNRELTPFTQVGLGGTCQALKREKLINRQLRHELQRASGKLLMDDNREGDIKDGGKAHRRILHNDASSNRNDFYDYYSSEAEDLDYREKFDSGIWSANASSGKINNAVNVNVMRQRKSDSNKNVIGQACNEIPGGCQVERPRAALHDPIASKNNISRWDNSEISLENCRQFYDRANLLGYLLTANFIVLFISCLLCVVTICKRQ